MGSKDVKPPAVAKQVLAEAEIADVNAIRKVLKPTTHPSVVAAAEALDRLVAAYIDAKKALPETPVADGAGEVLIETGIDGTTQRTAFQNATLSGPFGKTDVSIAVFPEVPETVADQGEEAIARHLEGVLGPVRAAGWSVEIQVGPSECIESGSAEGGHEAERGKS